jgi:hypothetical protein
MGITLVRLDAKLWSCRTEGYEGEVEDFVCAKYYVSNILAAREEWQCLDFVQEDSTK